MYFLFSVMLSLILIVSVWYNLIIMRRRRRRRRRRRDGDQDDRSYFIILKRIKERGALVTA